MAPKKKAPVLENELTAEEPLIQREDDNGSVKSDGKKRAPHKMIPNAFMTQVKERLKLSPVACKITDKDLDEICSTFVNTLVDQVKTGNTVIFTHKMAFRRTLRDERVCRNLVDGSNFTKDARYVMAMETMPALKKEFETIQVDAEALKTLRSKKEPKD